MSENFTLAKKRKIRAGAWKGKSQFHSERRWFTRRGGRAHKENLARVACGSAKQGGPFASKQKSEISDSRRRPMLTPWEKYSWES